MKYIIKALLLFLVLNACDVDRTERIFDEPPAIRIENTISELRTALLSQTQGFSGVYFPNNTEVGGINFHMNFNDNLRVKMTSDFKSTTSLTDTRYDIITGTSAAELVFTTGSRHITDLIQDGAASFNTFFGSNSFQFVGVENGVISFREIRSGGTLILQPSGFTNFDLESVASANMTFANKQAFVNVDCSTASVFDNLLLEVPNAAGTTSFILNYDPSNIFFDAETFNTDGSRSRQAFGAAFTLINGQEAIKISPVLEVGGNSFENFILDTSVSETQYVSTVNGVTARIFRAALSSPSGADLNNDIGLLESAFWYNIAFGNNPLTSPCFQEEVLDQITANLNVAFGPNAFSLTQFQFIFNFDSDACDNFLFVQVRRESDGQTFNSFYCYTKATIASNRLFQAYTEPIGDNSIFLETIFTPLIDFYDNPEGDSSGMLYTNEDSFSSDTRNFTNISGTFTKMDNQALRVYGLFFG